MNYTFVVIGHNYWGDNKVYIAKKLSDYQRPTPFVTRDCNGNEVYSKFQFETYEQPKTVTLKKGDYIMLLLDKELASEGDAACGHCHYYDGEYLRSVYTKRIF